MTNLYRADQRTGVFDDVAQADEPGIPESSSTASIRSDFLAISATKIVIALAYAYASTGLRPASKTLSLLFGRFCVRRDPRSLKRP